MTRARCLGLAALVGAVLVEAPAAWAQSGNKLIIRERANGTQSLLVGLENLPTGRRIDELRLKNLGSLRVTEGSAPEGWTSTQEGGEIRMRGMSDVGPIRFRFDATGGGRERLDRLVGKELELGAYLAGQRQVQWKIPVTLQPKVVVQNTLETSLFVPRRIIGGSPFLVSANPAFTMGRWSYTYSGQSYPLTSIDEAADFGEDVRRDLDDRQVQGLLGELKLSSPTQKYFWASPSLTFDAGTRLRFSYDDEWGDRLVDAEASKTNIRTAVDRWCAPGITGGAPLVFAGQTLCMSGCFPQPFRGLRLNDMVTLYPRAGSLTALEVYVPSDLMPGPSSIQMNGASNPFRFSILGVLGSIDQNLLWRGESTTMRLQVLGTYESLPIEIINQTPKTITVEGGERQVVGSAGGASNVLQRNVRGISKGDFAINYRLTNEACGFDDE